MRGPAQRFSSASDGRSGSAAAVAILVPEQPLGRVGCRYSWKPQLDAVPELGLPRQAGIIAREELSREGRCAADRLPSTTSVPYVLTLGAARNGAPNVRYMPLLTGGRATPSARCMAGPVSICSSAGSCSRHDHQNWPAPG